MGIKSFLFMGNWIDRAVLDPLQATVASSYSWFVLSVKNENKIPKIIPPTVR